MLKKIKQEFVLIGRSMRLMMKLTPVGEICIILWSVGESCLPFVNIYMSSLIVDELSGSRNIEVLTQYVFITLIANLLITLFSRALMQRVETEDRLLLSKLRLYLGEKGLVMDYQQVENMHTRVLRNRIEEAENSGFGGLSRFYGLQNYFIAMVVKTGIAAVMAVDVFRLQGQKTGNPIVDFFNMPWVSLVFAAVILLLSVYSAKSFKTAAQKLYDVWQDWPKHLTLGNYYSNEYMGENGAGKDIRLYNQKDLIMSEFNQHFARPKFLDDKIKINIKYDSINLSILALATGITYLFVSMKVLSGAFGIGSLIRFAGLILQFVDSFVRINSSSAELIMNNNYMRDIFAYLDMPTSMEQGYQKPDTTKKPVIEFDHVSFRYPDTKVDVLKNVSFRLEPGKNTALVGMNGSGKTTLIKLLCRLYDPTEGRILVNGIDIRKYDYGEYMKLFSVVFQDFRLFSFSLGENVASASMYAKETAKKMLDKAGFSQRLEKLEHGLDTVLYKEFDENGMEISGGEAQKIALARALYKDAPIMILDEPTAALDPLAEAEVYRKFQEITDEKTAVYISHRLSSCRFCDEILVMDQGKLVQKGKHEELVKDTGKRYYQLWDAQAQYYV